MINRQNQHGHYSNAICHRIKANAAVIEEVMCLQGQEVTVLGI